MKRGGAVLVTGMLGALGWVGYQQVSATPASDGDGAEQAFLLDGELSESPEISLTAPARQTAQLDGARTELEPSPFERSAASLRRGAASSAPVESADEAQVNPFAAFAKPAAPREVATETAASRRSTVGRADAGVVTLASNETAAPADGATVLTIEGQNEPASIDVRTSAMEPANQVPTPPAAADNDPFAAFAAAPAGSTSAESASSVPGSFGPAVKSQPVAVEAEWSFEPVAPAVTPVQFQAEPAPLPAGAGFDATARPLNPAPQFGGEPSLSPPAASADWSTFDQQPAAMEPGVTPATGRVPYSPATDRPQTGRFQTPQPAQGANDPRDEKLHVVQQGETYWSIARQHYGEARFFQALAEYNKPRISEQTALKPGMKVLVPSAETLDTRFGKLMQASGLAKAPVKPHTGLRFDAQGQPFYIVGEGDTLGEIARRYLGRTLRSDEIFRLNQEQLPNPNRLKAGMTLVMPADAAETPATSSLPGGR